MGYCPNLVQQRVNMPSVIVRDGSRIHYESYGSGKPMVFVHGWGISRVWQYQITEFSKSHRVITIDLRGHGESEGSKGDYSVDTLGNDLLEVIEKLELKDVILVAWSMGASAAIKLMVDPKPKEVGSLIIVAGTPMLTAIYERRDGKVFIIGKKGVIGTLFRLAKGYTFELFRRRGFLKNRLSIIMNCGPWANLKTLWGYAKTMANTDLTGILDKIKLPTLIIHGDRDIICPVEGAYYMVERIKWARLEILKGDDHTLSLTDPEQVNDKIREFISR